MKDTKNAWKKFYGRMSKCTWVKIYVVKKKIKMCTDEKFMW